MAKQAHTATSNVTAPDAIESGPSPQSESEGSASQTGNSMLGGPRRRDFGNLLQLPGKDPKILQSQVARFRELLKSDPDDQQSWAGLGRSLMDMGKLTEAIDVYRDIHANYPTWNYASHALMMIGICHDPLGAKEDGLAALEKAEND